MRLFTARVVLVINVVRSSLVNRLAGCRQEGLRFISVSSRNRLEHFAGSQFNTGLLSYVLCMAFRVGFYTQD